MTPDTQHDPLTPAALEHTAVAALTTLARDGSDFAEAACHVLATVAANVGGTEELLARRPGSWEADLIRQAITGTAGETIAPEWRTQPIRVVYDATVELDTAAAQHSTDSDDLMEREAALQYALIQELGTPDEVARHAELLEHAADHLLPDLESPEEGLNLIAEIHQIVETVRDRHPTAAESVELDAATAAGEALTAEWARDFAAARAAFVAAAREVAAERGYRVPVQVVTPGDEVDGDDLARAIEAVALARVAGASP